MSPTHKLQQAGREFARWWEEVIRQQGVPPPPGDIREQARQMEGQAGRYEEVLTELLCRDVCLRQQKKVPVLLEDYLDHYPELREDAALFLEFLKEWTRAEEHRRTASRYKAKGNLGAGAQGTVVYVEDLIAKREWALKIPHRRDDDLRRAVRAGYGLPDHKNLVPFRGIDWYEGSLCLKYEYCAGGNLRTRLEKGPIPIEDVLVIVQGIAEGLAAAHDQGVIHRDLKPENVLFSADGVPKLADFDQAKLSAPGSIPTVEVAGTPVYRAPELTSWSEVGATRRSDVWSFGVLLYELLTGTRPFRDEQEMSTARAQDRLPRTPSRCRPDLKCRNVLLDRICLKCLEFAPEKRYADGKELLDDLRDFLRRGKVKAPAVGPWARGWRWLRKHPVRLLASLVVAVSILAAPVLLVSLVVAQWNHSKVIRNQVNDDLQEALGWQDKAHQGFFPELASESQVMGYWERSMIAVRRANVRGSDLAEEDEVRLRASKAERDILASQAGAQREYNALRTFDQLFDRITAQPLQEYDYPDRTTAESLAKDNYPELRAAFEKALRDYGFPLEDLEGARANEVVSRSPIRADLVAALDLLAMLWRKTRPPNQRGWKQLLQVATTVDNDPWRNDLRRALLQNDKVGDEKLARLLKKLPASSSQPRFTVFLLVSLVLGKEAPLEVLEALDRLRDRDKKDFWTNAALAHLHAGGRTPDWEKAIRYGVVADSLRESSAARSNLGQAFLEHGEIEAAINVLEKCCQSNDALPEAHNNLGVAYLCRHRLQDADREFDRALEAARRRQRPLFAPAVLNRGIVAFKQQRYGKAVQDYSLILANPTSDPLVRAKAYSNRGRACVELHARQAGVANRYLSVGTLTTGLLRQPGLDISFVTAGIAAQWLRQADQDFQQATKLDDRLPEIRTGRAWLLALKGDLAGAVQESQQAVAMKPKDADTWYVLASIQGARGDWVAAMTAGETAVRLDPGHWHARRQLGICLLRRPGRCKEGLRQLQRAYDASGGDVETLFQLAIAEAVNGQLDDARDKLKQVLRQDTEGAVDPSVVWTYQGLVEKNRELARRTEAILKGNQRWGSIEERERLVNENLQESRIRAAAELYAKMYADHLPESRDPRLPFRLKAAAAAVLVSQGRATDAQEPTEHDCALWRDRALQWGRIELGLLRSLAKESGRKAEVRQIVNAWQTYPPLAPIRDTGPLRKLGPDERTKLKAFWKELETLLDR
jgi:serine/threonine protein kinase/Tfp pilus assembly protein PilF